MKKLWHKSDQQVDELIENFTIGNDPEFDLQLAKYDVQGTLAHVKMLTEVGLLTAPELALVEQGLAEISESIEQGQFEIEAGIEDVHSQVELLLTRKHGDVGKKIHSGRSRNDQVLVDLRLFFRTELQGIVQLVTQLFEQLLQQSERYQDVLMPGYTHTQVAMVSSFGLWLSAYAESMVDDMTLLQAVYRINNQNPLGSAAGYGSSFPLDRELTTQILEFDDLAYNAIHAQAGRGKTELHLSFALASLGSTLGRLATDIVLYSNENHRFLRLPDAFTTGSSIMPHKKNPDVFELIRAHCNLFQALPGQVSMLNSNLVTGYHRDYQLLKEVLFPALQKMKSCLQLTTHCLGAIEVNKNILADEKYSYLYTVEKVNDLVLAGTPFREAYQQVGTAINAGQFTYDGELQHTHSGSIGNLCLSEIRLKMKRASGSVE